MVSTLSNKDDLNPANGIYDVVDNSLGITVDDFDDVTQLGFYAVSLADFGIEQMDLSLTMSVELDASQLDPNFDLFSTSQGLEDLQAPFLNSANQPLSLFHILTPATLGAVSVFFTVGPLIEANGSMAVFAGLNLQANSKVDIQFGHIDLYSILKSPVLTLSDINPVENLRPEVTVTGNGLSDITVHRLIGGTGEATMRLGANVGLSAGGGEATTSGAAVGFMAPIGIEATLNGTGIASM